VLLIAGLGNPGKAYQKTRHNLGFMALGKLALRHRVSVEKRKFISRYGSGEILGEKVVLLTPLTYMNRSGLAVGSFLRYFQIPPDHLIILHDDLDLPFTRIRVARKGGAAGHKGVLSIIDQLKTQEFIRIRMGIGRPAEEIPPESYVLQPFTVAENKELPALTEEVSEAIEVIIQEGVTAAMNRFNIWKQTTLSEGQRMRVLDPK
jgi:peptidyl-tRNA hydrolase, PTH1 family